jgi:putative membrane protein
VTLLSGRPVGSPYGLRATLFTGLATLFCLLHARARHGLRFALVLLAVALSTSLTAEFVGTLTGAVFGVYHYGPDVPGRLFGLVPVVVPFAWLVVSYLSFSTAEAVCSPRAPVAGRAPSGLAIQALVGAGLLVVYDLVADPNHLHRGGWTYPEGGAYYGVPLQNFVAWFVLGVTSLLVLGMAQRRGGAPLPANGERPTAQLGVVAYVTVVLHESVFALLIAGHRGAGAFGLAVAGGLLALWWWRVAWRRPGALDPAGPAVRREGAHGPILEGSRALLRTGDPER